MSNQHQVQPGTVESMLEVLISIPRSKRSMNLIRGQDISKSRDDEVALQNSKPRLKNNNISATAYVGWCPKMLPWKYQNKSENYLILTTMTLF